MRKKILAGNWKMNHTGAAVQTVLTELVQTLPETEATLIIAPPFPYLAQAVSLTAHTPLHIAAQTMHWEEHGAFTGEVSPAMLVDIGVTHVLIGHSERREYNGETDRTVQQKVAAALQHGLTPIICCGETAQQRQAGRTDDLLGTQLRMALATVRMADASRVIVAYEPIWAIGTGQTARVAQAQATCAFLRRQLAALYNSDIAATVPILYGGSMKADNAAALLAAADIDGGLIGGASLQAASFTAIIRAADTI